MKKFPKIFFLLITFFGILFSPSNSLALTSYSYSSSFSVSSPSSQTKSTQSTIIINNNSRSYNYELIDAKIKLNSDSTFDVSEAQTFNFNGEYHQANRAIPFNKIDGITDIQVIDGETNQPLIYSPVKLDKTSSTNWGKYTSYIDSQGQEIEWYYNLANTTHKWILNYKIHGGIEFDQNFDRLYWNILTSYQVPIKNSQVTVFVPSEFKSDQIQYTAYRSNNYPIEQHFSADTNTVQFSTSNLFPGESFTVDVKFPPGFINRQAYWIDFLKIKYGYIFSGISIILTILAIFLLWLFREKLPESKRAIVPEYEPPQKLKPAIAEVITKERLTDKGLAATIIDLAVRGYLKIEEKKSSNWGVIMILCITIFIFACLVVAPLSRVLFDNSITFQPDISSTLMVLFIPFLFVLFLIINSARQIKITDYILTSQKPYLSDDNLSPYEQRYLTILFSGGEQFSTKSLRQSGTMTKRQFYLDMQSLKDLIYKEAQSVTNAYAVDLIAEKKKSGIVVVIVIVEAVFVFLAAKLHINVDQLVLLLLTLFGCVGMLYASIRYEARLNAGGIILKDEWLGFKLYLEVAEKQRLQNLTPDLFEKFLPYAMIFGVENKWAKAFETVNLRPPTWYGGSYIGSGGGYSSTSFSPTSFTSSFSASFASSFASSGASGGGGGGGAGGGGGGGGGGAS